MDPVNSGLSIERPFSWFRILKDQFKPLHDVPKLKSFQNNLTRGVFGIIFPIMETMEKAIASAILKLMRPLARILLRNGIPFMTFAELAKRVYVSVASEEFAIEGRKASVSRVSVITGLSRKEISRVKEVSGLEEDISVQRYNRAARVISGWVNDPRFLNEKGDPKELSVDKGGDSFADLVRLYSGDVPVRAILDELTRVGNVVPTADGLIRLLGRAYVPRTGDVDKIGILGTDVAGLVSTIDHNLTDGEKDPLFQRKVSYNNLPLEAMKEIRELSAKHGQELLELLNQRMSELDRDVNPEAGGTGRLRAGVGVYYFEENMGEARGEGSEEAKK